MSEYHNDENYGKDDYARCRTCKAAKPHFTEADGTEWDVCEDCFDADVKNVRRELPLICVACGSVVTRLLGADSLCDTCYGLAPAPSMDEYYTGYRVGLTMATDLLCTGYSQEAILADLQEALREAKEEHEAHGAK